MKRKGKIMETQKFSLTIPDDKQRIEDLLDELRQVRAEKTEALDKLIKVEARLRSLEHTTPPWADKTPADIRAVEDVKTLRDEMAIAAFQTFLRAWIDDGGRPATTTAKSPAEVFAEQSYSAADAMMKARAGA